MYIYVWNNAYKVLFTAYTSTLSYTNLRNESVPFAQSVTVNKFKQMVAMCNTGTTEIITEMQQNWLSKT